MIRKFKEYKKFREYIANSFECKFSIVVTILCMVSLIYFRYYEDFDSFLNITNTFLSMICAGFIGILALIFAGIIFWGSLFDEQFIEQLIRYTEDENVVDKLFTSYLYLAFNIIIYIVGTFIVEVAVNSQLVKIKVVVFYGISAIFIYWTFFIIGYAVAIMRNCVDLILIRNRPREEHKTKTIYDMANELRIDLVFELLYRNASSIDMHKDLMKLIKNRIALMEISETEKEELTKYMEEYYSLSKEEEGKDDLES